MDELLLKSARELVELLKAGRGKRSKRIDAALEALDVALRTARLDAAEKLAPEPIPMLLHCPMCGVRHVDEGRFATRAGAHRTHACQDCGHVWRPAMVPTVGVRFLPGCQDRPQYVASWSGSWETARDAAGVPRPEPRGTWEPRRGG